MLSVPGVADVTGITRMISGYRSGASVRVTRIGEENYQPMNFFGIDDDGISKLGMEIHQGESFSGMESQDSTSIILNETAAKMYGGGAIIGEYLELGEVGDDFLRAKVIGIVKDFHFESFHRPIGPIVIGYYKNPIMSLDDILVRLEGNNKLATLEAIEEIHNSHDRNGVMTWEFMDEMAQRSYEDELIFRNVFIGASLVSFCIAVLGMIGLSSYNIIARKKEIAIRKILGASYLNLFGSHSREFLKFLLVAFFVSVPICWWMAYEWLAGFAYRVSISPIVFLAVLSFLIVISLLVTLLVGNSSMRSNPVNAIRYE